MSAYLEGSGGMHHHSTADTVRSSSSYSHTPTIAWQNPHASPRRLCWECPRSSPEQSWGILLIQGTCVHTRVS